MKARIPIFLACCLLTCHVRTYAVNVDVAFPYVTSDSKIVLVNLDDDDGNGQPDKDQTTGPYLAEDDLQEINVSVQVGDEYDGDVKIEVETAGQDKIKLWADKEKTHSLQLADPWTWTVPITDGVLQPVARSKPVKFFVEGIKESATTDDVVIKATLSNGDVDDVKLTLLPVDLDIVYPATGELADAKEDIDDGGYVSVQRLEDPADATSDVTPKTKLKIHAVAGAQATWETRLKFNGADRFKIYRDEARTQEVVSEQTEFDATQDTTLFFHGLKKSLSRGGELVTMQVKINDAWVDGDSVKCTIVQSEFLIQVKGFIPYAWTEGEEEVPWALNGWSPMAGKVAKGDLHSIAAGNLRPASPGFRNAYSTDATAGPILNQWHNAPFRCCQTIVLTPYKELHSSYDLASSRRAMTAPSSDHYVKATSVNAAEISLKKGYMDLVGGTSSTGKGPIETLDYRQGARTGKITELHVEYGGVDGALGTTLGIPNASLSPDIHWDMWLKVNSEADPLLPTIEFGGKHDRYPAYEIIVIQSDGTYKPIHNVLPAATALPGPVSLDDDNAMSVGRSDTIRD